MVEVGIAIHAKDRVTWQVIALFCSYRFTDLFAEASLVRDMQTELDAVIQQGVIQLTRLLKNSETGISSGAAAAPDEDQFTINRQKQSYYRGRISNFCVLKFSCFLFYLEPKLTIGKGRLTERLLSQGLLTPSMLQTLKKEWTSSGKGEPENSDSDESSRKYRRKRKPKF